MKIGIIVYSQTGNTLAVAQRMMDKLAAQGHEVSLQQVSAANSGETDAGRIRLSSAPGTEAYDGLLFGAPVQGFALSPVMAAYLAQAGSLKGEKVACFLTQFFPHPSLGGNRAMGQLRRICEAKGATVQGTGIVNWSSRRREGMITGAVESLCRLF